MKVRHVAFVPICAGLLWGSVQATAQQVAQFPVPSPEGKAVSFQFTPGPRSPLPCVGVSDTLINTWFYETESRGLLYYCTVDEGGAAGLIVVLDTSVRVSGFMYMYEDRFSPVLALDAQGNAAVAWARQRGMWDDIAYPEIYDMPTVRCSFIKEGKASRVFTSVGGDHPSACFDAAGDLHLVYEQVTLSPYTMPHVGAPAATYFFVSSRLVYRIIHPNGTVDSVLGISRGFRPQLRIDAAGHRHLFWLEGDSSNVPAFALRYLRDPGTPAEVGSVIAPSVRARGDQNFNRRPPTYTVFTDNSGCAYAAWSDIEVYNSGTVSVAWSSSGQEWTTAQRTGLLMYGSPASFGVTPTGRIHASWCDYRPGPGIWAVREAQGVATVWLLGQTSTIPASSMYPGDPVFASDTRDSMHLVFDDGASGIGYQRDLASADDSTIHFLPRSLLAPGIRGLTETPGKQTSVAFDGSDQLWVVATGDSGLTLLRVDRKVTAVRAGLAARLHSSSLDQNFPNPFNPSTTISLTLGVRDLCIVKVYDVLGREVAALMYEVQGPGTYRVMFNGAGLPSGVYYCRMTLGGYSETRPMLLVR